MNKWYSSKTSSHQGLIIEEETGRNVAVSYDAKDAKLIAAAPELLNTLADAEIALLDFSKAGYPVKILLREIQNALANATGE